VGTFPDISNKKGLVEISFGDIPVWNGVQKIPGVRKCLPMKLLAHKGPIVQCASPQAIDDVVSKYEVDDYMFLTPPPGSSDWANSRGESHYKTVEKLIADGVSSDNILEVGAGSTWVADKLRKKYNPDSYVIIDPTIQGSAKNIEIIREYFPSPKIAGRRFDIILGFNVLEHVPDPVLFLRDAQKHLKDNGVVVLIYPDCEAQLLSGDINVFIHEHLTYFTEASTKWLASACGFEIRSIVSENDCFNLVLSRNPAELNEKFVLDESELLIKSVESFRCLLGKQKDKIAQCLEAGNTVGFHGATNGLNIFLHMTGLGSHSNIHVYDGDISKKGLYLPACSSPIKHTLDIDYSSHSLMVISAMSFFDQVCSFAIDEAGLEKSRLLPLVGLESMW
jgi:SAM-dependent methyltransferase